MKQKILIALLAAGMLILAGCGGGSSGFTQQQLDEAKEEGRQDALAGRTPCEGDGVMVDDDGNCVPDNDRMSDAAALDALQAAVDELDKLLAADDQEGSVRKAVADAMKKTGAVNALGSSAAVEKYGNAVLQARAGLQAALEDAKAERDAVTGDLADGAAGKSLLAAAKSAIDKAESDLADGKTPGVPRGEIAGLVADYEGKDKTPAERASDEAKKVFDRLITAAPITAGSAAGLAGSIKPDAPALPTAFATGNAAPSGAVSFEAIFGTEKNQGGMTALSLEGKPKNSVSVAPQDTAAGAAGVSADYLGISGMLFCYGADCKAGTGTDFGAGWHFVPAASVAGNQYVWDSDAGGYVQASYVEWGLWLTGGGEDPVVLNGFVGKGGGSADLLTAGMSSAAYGKDGEDVSDTDVTRATYNGAAAGLSARKMGTGDDEKYYSGHFKANVELNAIFRATSPVLSGTIDGFEPADGEEGTNHVDSAWSVSLGNIGLTDAGLAGSVGTPLIGVLGNNTDVAGAWNASAYRKTAATEGTDHHPDAFFGRFNARFLGDDAATATGAAAGNYHAEKQ